jgi:prepilin-type N-terminal cleavage/methylation domain-containing protein
MNHQRKTYNRIHPASAERGFTLIELMISMTISLLILSALVGMFADMSRSSAEQQKMNSLIEGGRFALQLLQDNLVHAGYWGGYLPQFDDVTSTDVPGDVPAIVPDVCAAFGDWDQTHRTALLGIPVQAYEDLPAGPGCIAPLSQRAGTDVLVIRHADRCVAGAANCDADVSGRLYFQASSCAAETNAGTALYASSDTLALSSNASAINNAYVGMTIRTVSGLGAAQFNAVTAYNGVNNVATLSNPWAIVPDNTTTYAFEYVLGTSTFPLHQRNCVGTGSPATLPITGGPSAGKRLFASTIYYIHDAPHPDRPGEVIPTLVRSQFGLSGGVLAHQAPVALIDGIEGLRVAIGIDDVSGTGAPVDYTDSVIWADPDNKIQPTNRGDGAPDRFVRCTAAAPCTAAQLTNAVAVKLYVLARSREPSPGHLDGRTYCLGEYAADGSCPAENQVTAANDSYKRHVFTTSVRLINTSARRESPTP